MATLETTGFLHIKNQTQQVSDKFAKREFVLKTEASSQYPQFVTMQLTQDKCSLLDQFSEGQELKVSFNLRGREWNGPDGIKYFNTLEAWRIEAVGSAPLATQVQNAVDAIGGAPTVAQQIKSAHDVINVTDDLPLQF